MQPQNATKSPTPKVVYTLSWFLLAKVLICMTVDVYGFFYHAMPSEGVMSLPELHSIVRDVWLTRHDAELEEERTLRRKGRPQSVKEIRLEEIKLRECEEYRAGFGNSLH
jgi:hypothetical protein